MMMFYLYLLISLLLNVLGVKRFMVHNVFICLFIPIKTLYSMIVVRTICAVIKTVAFHNYL